MQSIKYGRGLRQSVNTDKAHSLLSVTCCLIASSGLQTPTSLPSTTEQEPDSNLEIQCDISGTDPIVSGPDNARHICKRRKLSDRLTSVGKEYGKPSSRAVDLLQEFFVLKELPWQYREALRHSKVICILRLMSSDITEANSKIIDGFPELPFDPISSEGEFYDSPLFKPSLRTFRVQDLLSGGKVGVLKCVKSSRDDKQSHSVLVMRVVSTTADPPHSVVLADLFLSEDDTVIMIQKTTLSSLQKELRDLIQQEAAIAWDQLTRKEQTLPHQDTGICIAPLIVEAIDFEFKDIVKKLGETSSENTIDITFKPSLGSISQQKLHSPTRIDKDL